MPKTKQEIQKWFKDRFGVEIELGKSTSYEESARKWAKEHYNVDLQINTDVPFIKPDRINEVSEVIDNPYKGRDEIDISVLAELGQLAGPAASEFFQFYYSEIIPEKPLPTIEERLKQKEREMANRHIGVKKHG